MIIHIFREVVKVRKSAIAWDNFSDQFLLNLITAVNTPAANDNREDE